jgi:hypothetical protein
MRTFIGSFSQSFLKAFYKDRPEVARKIGRKHAPAATFLILFFTFFGYRATKALAKRLRPQLTGKG